MLVPVRVGGGPTEEDKAYRVLKSAEGVGGSAQDDSGIDGLWRRSMARGLAAATSDYRRAVSEAFPFAATDLISYYERALGLTVDETAPLADRRDDVAAAWPEQLSALLRDIEAWLVALDSRFSLLTKDDDKSRIGWFGRWLAPLQYSAEPDFGSQQHSDWAAYSTRWVLQVLFDVGYTDKLTGPDDAKRTKAREYLAEVLPPWWDFWIVTDTGFLTAQSLLGQCGVSDD
jgi:hypothetical protein